MIVKLRDVLFQDRRLIAPQSEEAAKRPYLGLDQVEAQTGRIIVEESLDLEIGESTTFAFDERHILYGKLRPYLNKVALPTFSGRCTTELIPFLPSDLVDRHFSAWLLRSPSVLARACSQNNGSRMPRADLDYLLDFETEIPDLPVQRRIAARLREQMAAVEAARKAVEEQKEGLKALIAAEIREGINCPETEFRSVGEMMHEVSNGVGQAWSDFPVLGATRNGLAAAKEPVGKNPQRYKPVTPGTVFYNPMRILIGSIAIVDDGDRSGITSPDYVAVRPRDGSVRSVWFYEWLRSSFGAAFISSLARGAVRERMLFSRLCGGKMPDPPIHWQERFEQTARQVRKAIAVLDEQAAAIEKLPAAYLRETFGGLS